MATDQTAVSDWRKEWFEIEDATYLNTAAHAAMPRVSLHAVQVSLEAKRFPHHINDSVWFEAPNRIRASLSKIIGAKPEEIALTTGASTGAAAVGTWPDVEAGRRDHHRRGRVPTAIRDLEAHGRTRGRETENRSAARPLYYGGRPDCRHDAENACHLGKSCAL